MDNLKLCEIHYLQGKHRQYKEKVPESLKLQRKRKEKDIEVPDNAETRAQRACKMAAKKKKKRKLSEGSEALVAAGPVRRKGDMQLELIRMVLKREVEKRKRNSKSKNKKKNKKKKKKKEAEAEEEGEELHHHYSEGELRRELPNGVMEISPASTPHDYTNVGLGSHCDVKVGVDYKAVTPRYFRSKNVDRVPVGKLQVALCLVLN